MDSTRTGTQHLCIHTYTEVLFPSLLLPLQQCSGFSRFIFGLFLLSCNKQSALNNTSDRVRGCGKPGCIWCWSVWKVTWVALRNNQLCHLTHLLSFPFKGTAVPKGATRATEQLLNNMVQGSFRGFRISMLIFYLGLRACMWLAPSIAILSLHLRGISSSLAWVRSNQKYQERPQNLHPPLSNPLFCSMTLSGNYTKKLRLVT